MTLLVRVSSPKTLVKISSVSVSWIQDLFCFWADFAVHYDNKVNKRKIKLHCSDSNHRWDLNFWVK